VEANVLTSRKLNGITLQAVRGDITVLPVDAVTNAANDHLWMGAGVAGAIRRAGGASIEEEAVSRGPIPVGEAVATGAGRLPARHVIHAAVMGQDLRTDLARVAATTRSVLELAEGMGLASVAMPLLGTGVGGLDLDDVASTMAREVARAAGRGACQGMTVLLVGYDEAASRAVASAVEGA
jgi:O-acetyl-ADP-ribose deacetylase (regulator of RNase III)